MEEEGAAGGGGGEGWERGEIPWNPNWDTLSSGDSNIPIGNLARNQLDAFAPFQKVFRMHALVPEKDEYGNDLDDAQKRCFWEKNLFRMAWRTTHYLLAMFKDEAPSELKSERTLVEVSRYVRLLFGSVSPKSQKGKKPESADYQNFARLAVILYAIALESLTVGSPAGTFVGMDVYIADTFYTALSRTGLLKAILGGEKVVYKKDEDIARLFLSMLSSGIRHVGRYTYEAFMRPAYVKSRTDHKMRAFIKKVWLALGGQEVGRADPPSYNKNLYTIFVPPAKFFREDATPVPSESDLDADAKSTTIPTNAVVGGIATFAGSGISSDCCPFRITGDLRDIKTRNIGGKIPVLTDPQVLVEMLSGEEVSDTFTEFANDDEVGHVVGFELVDFASIQFAIVNLAQTELFRKPLRLPPSPPLFTHFAPPRTGDEDALVGFSGPPSFSGEKRGRSESPLGSLPNLSSNDRAGSPPNPYDGKSSLPDLSAYRAGSEFDGYFSANEFFDLSSLDGEKPRKKSKRKEEEEDDEYF